MKRFVWTALSELERRMALRRPGSTNDRSVEQAVREILADVRSGGDRAVQLWTNRLDGFDGNLRAVSGEHFEAALASVDPAVQTAMDVAIAAIAEFHQAQVPKDIEVETAPGLVCRRVYRPLKCVGLYVPGGRAPLPSTMLMLGIPSRIAACPQRIVCTPPRQDGTVDPVVLVAAHKCGLDTVFPVGGAQAVGAMAYGTESVPQCDKIFGPGNVYVDTAKRIVAYESDGAALDLPAGPSEVLVLADDDADPLFVASDLLAQAEHDPVAHAVLATTSEDLASKVTHLLHPLADALPSAETARAALEHAAIIVADTREQLAEIANRYAPEHLILNLRDAADFVAGIESAGSVFLGPWTPEVLGDYCSGTNHVLPTGGFARAWSGLAVEDFLRHMTIQEATTEAMATIGPVAATLAQAEGLAAHERSILARLHSLDG